MGQQIFIIKYYLKFFSERVQVSETKARRVKFAAALETTSLRRELSKIKGKMIDMIAEIIS